MLKVKTSHHDMEVVKAKALIEERMKGCRIHDGLQYGIGWWRCVSQPSRGIGVHVWQAA